MLGSPITLDLHSQPGDAIVGCRACGQRLVVPAKAFDGNAERVLTFIDAHQHADEAQHVDTSEPVNVNGHQPQHR